MAVPSTLKSTISLARSPILTQFLIRVERSMLVHHDRKHAGSDPEFDFIS
jgi:hypothetical protein